MTEREHVIDGGKCWCEPVIEPVPPRKGEGRGGWHDDVLDGMVADGLMVETTPAESSPAEADDG